METLFGLFAPVDISLRQDTDSHTVGRNEAQNAPGLRNQTIIVAQR